MYVTYLITRAMVACADILRTGLQAFSFSIAVNIALSSSTVSRDTHSHMTI